MSTDGADALLSMENVQIHFEDDESLFGLFSEPDLVRAVDGVTLDIPENDVVALVGESGCGKTTLGKTALGMQRPSNGSVKYRGQDIWAARDGVGDVDIPFTDIRRALQIIHQDPGSSLNPYRKVKNSLAEPLKEWHPELNEEDRMARILSMLQTVAMTPPEDYAQRYPHQLSGGEKQRVALIRALLMNPDLILADEAVSALDVSLRVEMMDLMLDLQEQFDTSILFISHDLSNARYLTEKADGRIGIMYLGELVEIGPPEEILNDPKHPYTQALRWSSHDLTADSGDDDLPMRGIDIPDPVDPPSGCRFHTRCPKVIPPEDLGVDQETYNAIMDLRNDIRDEALDVSAAERRAQEAGTDTVSELLDEAFDDPLPEPHHDDVRSALERIVDEDDGDPVSFDETYESICERDRPRLPDGAHPAACHLHDGTSSS